MNEDYEYGGDINWDLHKGKIETKIFMKTFLLKTFQLMLHFSMIPSNFDR